MCFLKSHVSDGMASGWCALIFFWGCSPNLNQYAHEKKTSVTSQQFRFVFYVPGVWQITNKFIAFLVLRRPPNGMLNFVDLISVILYSFFIPVFRKMPQLLLGIIAGAQCIIKQNGILAHTTSADNKSQSYLVVSKNWVFKYIFPDWIRLHFARVNCSR